MKDTINEEDLMIDTTKSEMDKRLEASERKNIILQEKIEGMETQMKRILELVEKASLKVKN